jgi:sugar/nucleoside kinase (ribokinase family)
VVQKVLTIGGALHDIFIEFEDPYMLHLHLKDRDQSFIALEEGKKITVDSVHSFAGGGAANTATSFSRLGFDTQAFFKIGTDATGDFIIEQLKKEKVHLDHIIRTANEQTGTSFIIPCPSGDKSSLVYRGSNLTLTQKEIPLACIEQCDQLYVTSLSFNLAKLLPYIVKHGKKHGALVAVNPGSNQVRNGAADLIEALPYIDTLILNSYESKLLMSSLIQNKAEHAIHPKVTPLKKSKRMPLLLQQASMLQESCFSLPLYFREILSQGPSIVVVTNGAEGVYAAHGNTIYFYPSPTIKVVSTVGAGDSFGSAFIASLLQGKTIEQALIAGTLNSSSVLGHIGTQVGLLTKKEMAKRLKNANADLMQAFKL